MKLFSSIFLLYISIYTSSFGQSTPQKSLDPYGFVNKYDTTFNGIGPEVYIIPLPRTLKEEMIDTYKEIVSFQDSIRNGLQYQRILSYFQKTSNQDKINSILPDSTIVSEETVKPYIEQNNHPIVYALYNGLALKYLLENKTREALQALGSALSHAESSKNPNDIAIIKSNIASAYLLTGKLEDAGHLENFYLLQAQKNKELADQGSSQTRIALIESYKKNYKAAENTIIRNAIPLFNKSKFYAGKIEAWTILAEIYRTQNKHTEAQWFLIQARDLAKNQDLPHYLAMIEYMLGSSKMIQNNYRIAKNELELAWQLAKDGQNKHLQIAITEQLGRANVNLGDYKTAKVYLDRYWELRNALF